MPYSDPQKKREWEQEHRSRRLSRRRELRRIEAARIAAQPEPQWQHRQAGLNLCSLWSLEVP